MLNKRGNITVLLIGLVSVMIFTTVALSRRMRSHTQLITLSDYTQITRYYLESYVSEVIQFIREEANKPSENPNSIYMQLRKDQDINYATAINPSNEQLNLYNYSKTYTLDKIATAYQDENAKSDELKITQATCSAIIRQSQTIKSNAFTYGKTKERKGTIEITCSATLKERRYTLNAQIPYTVVYRMMPVLKDFSLFVDNISKEQAEKIGQNDKINLLFTSNGFQSESKHFEDYDKNKEALENLPEETKNYKMRPFTLLQPLDGQFDEKTSGQVYLGSTNDSVYLNLASDASNENSESNNQYACAGETNMLFPNDIGLEDNEHKIFVSSPLFEGSDIKGPSLSLNDNKIDVNIYGFSKETATLFSIFKQYKISEFLNTGNEACDFWRSIEKYGDQTNGYLSVASGLKLYGLKFDENQERANRRIYGNVYGRFIVFSFKKGNSSTAPSEPLIYKHNPDSSDNIESYEYRQFMSKMVSGNKKNENCSFMSMYRPTDGKSSEFLTKNTDFESNDGIKLNCELDNFGETYLNLSEENGIKSRIGRTFENQIEFKKEIGLNEKEKKFQINGVIRIKGDLSLENGELTNIDNKFIGGGIIIADGKIRIGDVTRNEKDLTSEKMTLENDFARQKYIDWTSGENKITQDKFLTFVSLSKEKSAITVTGNYLIGVQLITLCNKNKNNPYTQIEWLPKDPSKGLCFLGGIACNYLDLKNTLVSFGKIDSTCEILNAPFFIYSPEMAASTPSLAVQIPQNAQSYKLSSKYIGKK